MATHIARRLPCLSLLAVLFCLPAAAATGTVTTVKNFVGARSGAIGTLSVGSPVYGPKTAANGLVKYNNHWVYLARNTAIFDVTFTDGGSTRRFAIVRPEPATKAAPALLMLHGAGGDPEGQVTLSYVAASVAANGYWAVLPQGLSGSWNTDPLISGGANDVGFIAKVIDIATGYFGLNGKRVYASGMSEGGFMTARLACELSDRIAAFATVAATLSSGLSRACTPSSPRTLLMFSGTADTLVPYNGGRTGVLSVADAFNLWLSRNNCTASSTASSNLPDSVSDGTSVTLKRNSGCGSGGQVRLYTINNGGHTWPGGYQYLPEAQIGKTSQDLSATAELWQQLSTYSL